LPEDNIKKKLDMHKYKLTEQRATVLEVMVECKGKHLSAEEVFNRARKILPNIGIATVYRTLESLSAIGILYKNMFDEGKYRYELYNDNDYHYHHHLICLNCGKIMEVEDDFLNNLEQYIELQGFKIVDHDLKFYGYCPDCR